MLTKIRDKATGWLAYAIVIVISIPFALWGIQQYFSLDSSPVAIEIDNQEVTEFQLEQAILNKKRQLEQAQIDFRFSEKEIKTEVVGEIVSEQLLILAIKKYNLQTTNQELADFIKGKPEFKTNQRFDADLYRDLLARSGVSVTDFERFQKEALKEEQLVSLVQGSSFILPSERKRYVHLADQKRKIRYLPVSYSYFIEPDSIDIEQARAHYDANMALYQSPYKVNLDYLEIDLDKLQAEQTVSDEEARTYYEQRSDDYLYPEKFNLRHILISTEDLGSDEALVQADELYRQLEEGADFADLARAYSDDDLTATDGGKLPELTAEELDNDAVRDAILQLAEGEFTRPIRTRYGVQIFQLAQLSEAEQKPFNEVRKELVGDIKNRKARIRYANLIENLDILLFEDEIGFFEAVRANYGYDKKNTGFIDLNKQESILANPRIRTAVISEIIQGGKINSGLIEVEPGKRFFFVGITNAQPSLQLSFEDAMQDVITYLILQQAHRKARENNESWIKELQAANLSLDDIATANQWTIEETGYIERTETTIPRPIVEKTFATRADKKLPIYQTLQLDDNYNNDHVIMELLDIEEGKETSQTFVIYSLQNREAVALLDSLRDFHEVKINVEIDEEEETSDEAETSDEEEDTSGEAQASDEEAETSDAAQASDEEAETSDAAQASQDDEQEQ